MGKFEVMRADHFFFQFLISGHIHIQSTQENMDIHVVHMTVMSTFGYNLSCRIDISIEDSCPCCILDVISLCAGFATSTPEISLDFLFFNLTLDDMPSVRAVNHAAMYSFTYLMMAQSMTAAIARRKAAIALPTAIPTIAPNMRLLGVASGIGVLVVASSIGVLAGDDAEMVSI